jgi:hypothetical protein
MTVDGAIIDVSGLRYRKETDRPVRSSARLKIPHRRLMERRGSR